MSYQSWWISNLDGLIHIFDGEACIGLPTYVALCGHTVDRGDVDKTGASWPCWDCHRMLRADVPHDRAVAELENARRHRAELLNARRHRALA